jgi:hypothetical protein
MFINKDFNEAVITGAPSIGLHQFGEPIIIMTFILVSSDALHLLANELMEGRGGLWGLHGSDAGWLLVAHLSDVVSDEADADGDSVPAQIRRTRSPNTMSYRDPPLLLRCFATKTPRTPSHPGRHLSVSASSASRRYSADTRNLTPAPNPSPPLRPLPLCPFAVNRKRPQCAPPPSSPRAFHRPTAHRRTAYRLVHPAIQLRLRQPQRIPNHGHGAQAHGRAGNHRAQQPAEHRI